MDGISKALRESEGRDRETRSMAQGLSKHVTHDAAQTFQRLRDGLVHHTFLKEYGRYFPELSSREMTNTKVHVDHSDTPLLP